MYIVIELQKTGNQVGNFVFSYQSRNEADSKFYSIMSAAAVSRVIGYQNYASFFKIYKKLLYELPSEQRPKK